MTNSRILAVLSFLAAMLTTAAAATDIIPANKAIFLVAGAAAISAFTERIQGGKSLP